MGPFSPLLSAALIVAQLDSQLDSQVIDASNLDVDSQLSIARGSNGSLAIFIDFTLLRVPSGIEETRRRVFQGDFLMLEEEKYNRLWLFVSNIWVLNQTRPRTKKKSQTIY